MNWVNKTNWQNILSSMSSHATKKETFMVTYNNVLPRTPKVKPKSKIYTPKWDYEYTNIQTNIFYLFGVLYNK